MKIFYNINLEYGGFLKISSIYFLIFSFASGCTGLNLINWSYGSASHPSPTPEYTHPGIFYRGGFVIHRNTIPGGLGKKTKGELVKGESCSWSAVWLVAGGDSSLDRAKKNAGIESIHSVEYRQEATLGFVYHEFCTLVVGTKSLESSRQNSTKQESGIHGFKIQDSRIQKSTIEQEPNP